MFFDIGGWWLTCDHMFRRFGTPFASDWMAKKVNGYLYTAAIPADRKSRSRAPSTNAATSRACRGTGSTPADRRLLGSGPAALRRGVPRLVARAAAARDRAQLRLPRRERHGRAELVALAVLLEDAIDIHERHWKIHWMINFAQFSATLGAEGRRSPRSRATSTAALPGRLQWSVADRNWDSIEALWRMKNQVKADPELRRRLRRRDGGRGDRRALAGSEAGRPLHRASVEPYQRSSGASRSGRTSSSTPTWFERPAPDPAGGARLPRDRLRLPGRRSRA